MFILKQFVGNLPTICLSVFDHFVGLVLKGLIKTRKIVGKTSFKMSVLSQIQCRSVDVGKAWNENYGYMVETIMNFFWSKTLR